MKPCVKCGASDRNKNGDCKPCQKKIIEAWREKNKEKIREYSKKYRKENAEKIKIAMSNWYYKNKDGHLKKCAEWQRNNPVLVGIRNKKWKSKNPESVRMMDVNRKAMIRKSGGKLSKGLVSKLLTLQKNRCAICRRGLSKHHLDHVVPVSLGGKNVDSNIQLLCPKCNLQKGSKNPIEFMQSKGFLV